MAIGEKIIEFFTGGVAKDIADTVGKAIPDKDLAAKLSSDLQTIVEKRVSDAQQFAATLDLAIVQGQNDTNKIEAGSDSLLKSGWRPMVGWVCVAALAYQMVVRPLLAFGLQHLLEMPPPSLDLDTLLTLLFGILGLGAYRTAEKIKGVS